MEQKLIDLFESRKKDYGKVVLDLACGARKAGDEKIGIDAVYFTGVDYIMDLQVYPWPIDSGSVDELYSSHYVEHIKHDNVALDLVEIANRSNSWDEFKQGLNAESFLQPKDGFVKFMEEAYRILKPGGKFKVIVPYYANRRAFQDPTHVRFMAETSFGYLNKQWRQFANIPQYDINCDFDMENYYQISNELTLKSEIVRKDMLEHDLNVIDDLIVDMVKR